MASPQESFPEDYREICWNNNNNNNGSRMFSSMGLGDQRNLSAGALSPNRGPLSSELYLETQYHAGPPMNHYTMPFGDGGGGSALAMVPPVYDESPPVMSSPVYGEIFPATTSTTMSPSSNFRTGGVNVGSPVYMPPPPLSTYQRPAKDGWTPDRETMLVTLRQAGHEFPEIAKQMQTRFGTEFTPNALVKRYHKLQAQFLEVRRILFSK